MNLEKIIKREILITALTVIGIAVTFFGVTYAIYFTIDETKKILEQLENCICKVFIDDESKVTGFFCNIKYDNKVMPVLITNNRVLNEDRIKLNSIIKICFNKK